MKKYISVIGTALLLLVMNNQIIYGEEETPEEYISIDESFTTVEGNEYNVTMTGLTEENSETTVQSLTENFDSGEPLKMIDENFCDAEKWSADFSFEYWNDYDASQCWAASTSNLLWMSGWAGTMVNPSTNQPFQSEDEVFEYISRKFTNRGGDIQVGIDWFFTGEVFPTKDANHAQVLKPVYEEDGLMKEIDSTQIHTTYDLIEDPSQIEQILNVSQQADNPVVVGASIGDLFEGKISVSGHAVAIAGVITDPNATSFTDKYKGIILIDSDNDGHVSPEEAAGDPPFGPDDLFNPDKVAQRRAYRAEVKKNRMNSYTLYPLSYQFDVEGTPYWQIDHYSQYGEPSVLYRIVTLNLPNKELISKVTETEGSKNIFTDVDLTLDYLFTSDQTELTLKPYSPKVKEVKKETFESGTPINLMYYLGNRSRVIFNDKVLIEWTITRDFDGTVVSQGSLLRDFDIYSGIKMGDVLELNPKGEKWCSGDYTVTLYFNTDKAIKEAYYLNNKEQSVHITITGWDCPCEHKEEIPPVIANKQVVYTSSSVPTSVQTDVWMRISLFIGAGGTIIILSKKMV